jgi:hypothetical protein
MRRTRLRRRIVVGGAAAATAWRTAPTPRGGDTEASALVHATVNVRWPLSVLCTRPAGLLQHRLSEERN